MTHHETVTAICDGLMIVTGLFAVAILILSAITTPPGQQ